MHIFLLGPCQTFTSVNTALILNILCVYQSNILTYTIVLDSTFCIWLKGSVDSPETYT